MRPFCRSAFSSANSSDHHPHGPRRPKRMIATRARGALGRTDVEDWDHAFIVRREAREALENLRVEA